MSPYKLLRRSHKALREESRETRLRCPERGLKESHVVEHDLDRQLCDCRRHGRDGGAIHKQLQVPAERWWRTSQRPGRMPRARRACVWRIGMGTRSA
jgi:hypothetical protein